MFRSSTNATLPGAAAARVMQVGSGNTSRDMEVDSAPVSMTTIPIRSGKGKERVDGMPHGHVDKVIVLANPEHVGAREPDGVVAGIQQVASDLVQQEVLHPVTSAVRDTVKTTTDTVATLAQVVSKKAAQKVNSVGRYIQGQLKKVAPRGFRDISSVVNPIVKRRIQGSAAEDELVNRAKKPRRFTMTQAKNILARIRGNQVLTQPIDQRARVRDTGRETFPYLFGGRVTKKVTRAGLTRDWRQRK